MAEHMSQADSDLLWYMASLTVVGRTVSEVPYLMRWSVGRACPRPTLNSSIVVVCLFVFFDLILYVPSTIFQLNRDESSWVEPVLS